MRMPCGVCDEEHTDVDAFVEAHPSEAANIRERVAFVSLADAGRRQRRRAGDCRLPGPPQSGRLRGATAARRVSAYGVIRLRPATDNCESHPARLRLAFTPRL